MVDTEQRKIARFLFGLRKEFGDQFQLLLLQLTHKFCKQKKWLTIELKRLFFLLLLCLKAKDQLLGRKRVKINPPLSSRPHSYKRPQNNHQHGSGHTKPLCRSCCKNHSGPCLTGSRVCFNCGKEGHIVVNWYSSQTPNVEQYPPSLVQSRRVRWTPTHIQPSIDFPK